MRRELGELRLSLGLGKWEEYEVIAGVFGTAVMFSVVHRYMHRLSTWMSFAISAVLPFEASSKLWYYLLLRQECCNYS
jgi:hypothetical protein